MTGRAALLALGLSACAYTPPREPFQAGDTLTLRGTTQAGEALSQTFRLVSGGRLAPDGHWEYVADGVVSGVAALLVGPGQKLAALVDGSQALGNRPDATITACVVEPGGPGWQAADGLLVQGSLAAMLDLAQGLDWTADLDTLRGVVGESGTCRVSRP